MEKLLESFKSMKPREDRETDQTPALLSSRSFKLNDESRHGISSFGKGNKSSAVKLIIKAKDESSYS